MRKLTLIVVLFAALIGPTSEAGAQPRNEMVAYEGCYPYYWSGEIWDWSIVCSVFASSLDGLRGGQITQGANPTWSPDGSRIAVEGFEQPGIFIMNLSDWSVTTLVPDGGSPAWSPDGSKIAFSTGELNVIGADGTNLAQVTNNMGFAGEPAWAPDGRSLLFDCEIEGGNRDICTINADGTGLVRLTSDPAWDSDASLSPDGLTIVFTTTRYIGGSEIVLMNADGTGISRIGNGLSGQQPAWSTDGTRIAFAVLQYAGGYACEADGRYCPDRWETVYIVDRDGTYLYGITGAKSPAWTVAAPPVASFGSLGCDDRRCSFNGSASWGGNGGIVKHTWDFGDGTTASGAVATHTFIASGTYTITLTVEDGEGTTGTKSVTVRINSAPIASLIYTCSGSQCTFDASASSDSGGPIANYYWNFGDGESLGPTANSIATHLYRTAGDFTVRLTVVDSEGATATSDQIVSITNKPPSASFTVGCAALTCTFDAAGSSDTDGTIVSYAWYFGDGSTGTGRTVSHTYAARGSYSVFLTVADDGAATTTAAKTIIVAQPMHVGDLDRVSSQQQRTWSALITIAIHDSGHAAVDGALVTGAWSDGMVESCRTDATGRCDLWRTTIAKNASLTFAVTGVGAAMLSYTPAHNHDPDGDSNGTAIAVPRR